MNNDLHAFEQFMQQRAAVAQAYVCGEAAPLGRIVTRVSPATFFSPKGGYRQGADNVFATYEHDATSFEEGGDSSIEILQMAASDGIAYWVGFQNATAHIRGRKEVIPMKLRITEVFRREGDEWKLVHRHADTLASETEENKK